MDNNNVYLVLFEDMGGSSPVAVFSSEGNAFNFIDTLKDSEMFYVKRFTLDNPSDVPRFWFLDEEDFDRSEL